MTLEKKEKINYGNKLPYFLVKIGKIFVGISLLLLILIYFPVIKEEVRYYLRSKKVVDTETSLKTNSEEIVNQGNGVYYNGEYITPKDENFGIVVPKIGANASVIQDVDPFNPNEYQLALTKGVAQAKGSALPNQLGNVFIFAHSSDNFYNANKYNAVFYLLKKLEIGDKFYLIKDSEIYEYDVAETKLANPEEISYLEENPSIQQSVTLMTCWPPGTTLQRFIVIGELTSIYK